MATSTVGIVNVSSRWIQRADDLVNVNNSVVDQGQLAYQYTYSSGSTTGVINEVYHLLTGVASGSTGNYNLQSLSQNLIGYNISKSFTDVYSISVKNHSTVSGYNIILNVNSASGFKKPFGYPTGSIVIGPGACRHASEVINAFPVGAGSNHIQIIDGGSGARYELVILGHA